MLGETTPTAILLITIAVLQVVALIAAWMDREVRRESTGGLHDRLDVLMGRRCAWCDKHLGNGALKLPKEQTCSCPATAEARNTPHASTSERAADRDAGKRTAQPVAPARKRRRRRRRPARRPDNESEE